MLEPKVFYSGDYAKKDAIFSLCTLIKQRKESKCKIAFGLNQVGLRYKKDTSK